MGIIWQSTQYVCTYLFSSVTSNSVIFLCIEGKKSALVWNYGANFCCLCILNACAQSCILTRWCSITFQFYFCNHDVTSKPWEMLKQRKWNQENFESRYVRQILVNKSLEYCFYLNCVGCIFSTLWTKSIYLVMFVWVWLLNYLFLTKVP